MMIDTTDDCYCFLIRHGATASNLADPPILQGRSVNGPLSETGQRQAAEAAAFLASQPLAAIYSSPLVRARETAEIIAGPHNLVPSIVEPLTEVDVGAWERRSWVEIEKTEPEAYRNFQSDPAQHGYRDGESLNDVRARCFDVMESIMAQHHGDRIAIVAHNVVNRVFLAHALELPLKLARKLTQANCGINYLRYREGGTKVIGVNSVFHLSQPQ